MPRDTVDLQQYLYSPVQHSGLDLIAQLVQEFDQLQQSRVCLDVIGQVTEARDDLLHTVSEFKHVRYMVHHRT
jgi:hypothetical protein